MGSRSKCLGALKPHEILAKLKKGSHPCDGKLYPVMRDEYGGVCVLECKDFKPPSANNPSKSKRKPQDCQAKATAMRFSPSASPIARGAVRRMQEEMSRSLGSSMTSPKRAKE
eukprot:1145631-Pelagomonas_calceolata.AAC.3